MNSLNRFADPVYCIMRLIVGLMFACHGGQKVLGFPGGGHGGAEGLMLIGGIIELVCGLMIAFGILTSLGGHYLRWRNGRRLFHGTCRWQSSRSIALADRIVISDSE